MWLLKMPRGYVRQTTQLSTALTEILCRGWVRQNMDPCQDQPPPPFIVAIRQDGRRSIGRQCMSMTSPLNLRGSFRNLNSSKNAPVLGLFFARRCCEKESQLE